MKDYATMLLLGMLLGTAITVFLRDDKAAGVWDFAIWFVMIVVWGWVRTDGLRLPGWRK
jgi:hypothetical protein